MNKKVLTLCAGFLLAGSFAAEAGVVKVAVPVNGHSYVIAEPSWGTTAKMWLVSDGADVESPSSAAVNSATIDNKALWKYVENGNGFILQQGDFAIGNEDVTGDPSMRSLENAVVFTVDAAGHLVSGSEQLKLTSGDAADWATAGTAINFYAYTEEADDKTGVTLKVGNQYLVVTDAAGTVKLVNEDVYQAYLKVGESKRTLWDLDGGKYKSQYDGLATPANNYLQITASSSSVAASTNASSFELNETEGLFGIWNSTSATFSYVKVNATGDGLISSTTASEDDIMIETATPAVSPNPANPQFAGLDLATSVVSGEYYLITSNGNTANVLVQEDNSNPATMKAYATLSDEELETAYWAVSVSYDSTQKMYKYSFTNKAGVTLKVGGVSEFYSENAYASGVTLETLAASNNILTLSTTSVTLGGTSNNNTILGFYKVGTADFAVKDLCKYYNTYFDLNLMDKKGGTSDLKGDLFDGGLIPMEIGYDAISRTYYLTEANANATTFLLKRKADDAYIVLDWDEQWSDSGIDHHVTEGGYVFDKLSEDNLLAYINGTAIKALQDRNLGFAFAVEYAGYEQTANNKAVKFIKVVDYAKSYIQSGIASVPAVSVDDRARGEVQYPVYLTTFEADGTTYLTVNADKDDVILYAELQEKTLVHGSDKNNNPLNWKYVNIKFVNHASVKYTTEDGRAATLDGKVLGMARDNGANTWEAYPAEANKFLADKPEGQWAVSMTNASAATNKNGVSLSADKNEDVAFTFTNRENPAAQYTVARMYNLGNNKFAVEYDYRGAFSTAYNAGGIGRDTLEITPVNIESEGARLMDGYKNYTDAEIQDTEYRLIMNSTSNVDYYVSENHAGKHLLGISTNEADAVNWRLVRFDREAIKDVDGYDKYATDSIYVVNHPQYLASDGKYYAYNDTLAIVTYALQNTANGEYLTYEDLQSQDILSMMCDPESENFANHYYNEDTEKETWSYLNGEYRFVIKEKMDGLFNILGVNGGDADRYGYSLNLNNKLYGASTKNTVEVETAYTQINSNDLFRLEAVDAPVYREVAQGDTIRLFREENNAEVLYENGQFLNLGNIDQLKDEMAPALYVDTAYINRGTNTRYQYLLAVNVDRVEPVYDNAGHMLEPDTTYGRFLINHIDSAVWTNENGNIHQNKFINDVEADEPYVKVGFHWGYRTKDQLFLTDKSYQKVEEVINLNSRDFNKAKFAFRYTTPSANDPESAFKIQTRYISYNDAIEGRTEENNNGFLRTVNGVVVVVPGYAKGEEFNLAAEHSTPTANESITAEGAVSVTATDGAVVIKGAEGKNVVIATILGKVVANETVNSDNETIAVPAGIAVVSVDGESFKVVVK